MKASVEEGGVLVTVEEDPESEGRDGADDLNTGPGIDAVQSSPAVSATRSLIFHERIEYQTTSSYTLLCSDSITHSKDTEGVKVRTWR